MFITRKHGKMFITVYKRSQVIGRRLFCVCLAKNLELPDVLVGYYFTAELYKNARLGVR